MPINDVAAARANILARIKTGGVLSNNDVNKLLEEIKKDGVTTEEVQATVTALVDAMKTGWDPAAGTQTKRIDKLLGQLHAARPDAVDVAAFTQAGKVNWLGFVLARAAGTTPPVVTPPVVTPPVVTPPTTTTTGPSGLPATLTLTEAPAELRAQLQALAKPGAVAQLDVPAGNAAALASSLTSSITAVLPVATDDTHKYETASAVFASVAVLSQPAVAGKLSLADVDALIGAFEKLPSPMAQAVALRALEGATKTPAQASALAAVTTKTELAPMIAAKDALLATFDDVRSERFTIGYSDKLTGAGVDVVLTALSFAKDQSAVDSLKKGLDEYAKVNAPSSWQTGGLDAQEAKLVADFLPSYVNNASATTLVFGAFLQDAPKEVAKATNARVAAALAPLLEGSSPKIGGVPLTPAQAAVIKNVLAGVKDEAAAKDLARALTAANAAFATGVNQWGGAPAPTKPLDPVAFAAFERVVTPALDGAKGNADGMIDMATLARDVEGEARAIGETMVPALRSLGGSPPKMGDVVVSADLAATLKGLLLNRSRSALSTPNLQGAVDVAAKKYGGTLEGAGAGAFQKILDEYLVEFPNVAFLDFNKLGRITSFKIEGQQVPLCTLNGVKVPLADYFAKVAGAVAASIDKSVIRHDWIADRWGWRAKASVELLDVIAQKTHEKAGPIFVLQQQFPNANVQVLATGKDGEHERLLYQVEGRPGLYAEGSDGVVTRYDGRNGDPVLFTATVKDDGSFDVQVPTTPRKITKYPIQTPWSPGDSVDINYFDKNATERAEEGKPFETKYKILEATIKSFTGDGKYVVAFKDPQGNDQVQEMTVDQLRKQNSPHYFTENADHFSDVDINIKTDQQLATFLDGVDPIIAKYLPTDGSLLGLSVDEMTKRQKDCIDAMMAYCHEIVTYPAEGQNVDDASRRYHELTEGAFGRIDLGKLVELQRGVCRHQCILEHLMLQRAGIDSRLASGAANTSSGDFRGFHIWVELNLADGDRYMSDQTWDDAAIPLWKGAYGTDKRRLEMYDRTSRYDTNVVD